MANRKRHGILEINLTSLLDVLFCILFIVMLTNINNDKESQQQINELQEELDQSLEEMELYKTQIKEYESYELYIDQAVIITIRNLESNREHLIHISEGLNTNNPITIPLGLDRLEIVKARINDYIISKISPSNNQPVRLFFYVDKSQIYRQEYEAIKEILLELQNKNKQIFYSEPEGENK